MSNKTNVRLAVIGLSCATWLSAQAQPGTRIWEHATGDAILSSPALVNAATLYVGSYDQTFYAVNATNGNLRWKFSVKPSKATEAAYIYSSPAAAPDGSIYFGTDQQDFATGASTGNLYALNSDGTLRWTFPVGAAIYSDPAIGPDGAIYFGCFDTNLYALNPDGTQRWKFQAGDTVFSDPVLGTDGAIYFGCDDHNLYALNPNGTRKWTFDTGGPVTASPTIGPDGTVYIGTTSSLKFYAVNPDGTKKWEFLTAGRIYSSAALGAEGTIYFGSNDGVLYALHADGILKWRFAAGGAVRSSPAIATDGTIYVGCDDGKLYAVNAGGSLVWSYAAADAVYASPVVGVDGTVYVSSADHSLYAIQGAGGLGATPWPMFRHDPVHTGRAGTSADTPPTISPIADQSIQEGGTVGPLAFTVGDAESGAASLKVAGASSNPTLVPEGATVFGGSGSNRTVTITPAANQLGSATITITVIDAEGSTATASFVVSVGGILVPTIQSIEASAGRITLTWSSVPGVNYRVQLTDDLATAPWTGLAGDVQADATTAAKQDTLALAPARFYRILVLP